jgi:hypothetical protein
MKRDFSGEYVLDRTASALSAGAAAVQSAVMRIDHREPVFRCSANFVFVDGKTFPFSFELLTDGREAAGGESEVSRMYWQDDALVSEYRTTTPEDVVIMSWQYELIDSGRGLQATERIRGGGRDQDNVWRFARSA